jgi:hypothetical protein
MNPIEYLATNWKQVLGATLVIYLVIVILRAALED